MTPPNIVYLMFDQAKARAMSFLGNDEITMPFCDGLAGDGWVFEQAYSAAPICTPSRASVHTGMYPQVHGVTCHQNRAPFNLPQLAELLQQAGYYTAAAGHYEPERNLCRGWHEQAPMHERGPLFESLAGAYQVRPQGCRLVVRRNRLRGQRRQFGAVDRPGAADARSGRGERAAVLPAPVLRRPAPTLFRPPPLRHDVRSRRAGPAGARRSRRDARLARRGTRRGWHRHGHRGRHAPGACRLLRDDPLHRRRDGPGWAGARSQGADGEHLDHPWLRPRRLHRRERAVQQVRVALRLPLARAADHRAAARFRPSQVGAGFPIWSRRWICFRPSSRWQGSTRR